MFCHGFGYPAGDIGGEDLAEEGVIVVGVAHGHREGSAATDRLEQVQPHQFIDALLERFGVRRVDVACRTV